MSALDILLQFLTTVKNPFVIAACMMAVLLRPSRLAIRLTTILVAMGIGTVDSIVDGVSGWSLIALLVSGFAGLLVAEVALNVMIPCLLLTLALARLLVVWLRMSR